MRESPGPLAAGGDHAEQGFGADQVELAAEHRATRELTGLGEPSSALDHRREQSPEVVRAAVAVELGDVLAGERRRRPHREREHLIDALARGIFRPT